MLMINQSLEKGKALVGLNGLFITIITIITIITLYGRKVLPFLAQPSSPLPPESCLLSLPFLLYCTAPLFLSYSEAWKRSEGRSLTVLPCHFRN